VGGSGGFRGGDESNPVNMQSQVLKIVYRNPEILRNWVSRERYLLFKGHAAHGFPPVYITRFRRKVPRLNPGIQVDVPFYWFPLLVSPSFTLQPRSETAFPYNFSSSFIIPPFLWLHSKISLFAVQWFLFDIKTWSVLVTLRRMAIAAAAISGGIHRRRPNQVSLL